MSDREMYLGALAGEYDGQLPPPSTRSLKWMAKLLGQDVETEPVQSPEEAYLKKIAESGGGGESGALEPIAVSDEFYIYASTPTTIEHTYPDSLPTFLTQYLSTDALVASNVAYIVATDADVYSNLMYFSSTNNRFYTFRAGSTPYGSLDTTNKIVKGNANAPLSTLNGHWCKIYVYSVGDILGL